MYVCMYVCMYHEEDDDGAEEDPGRAGGGVAQVRLHRTTSSLQKIEREREIELCRRRPQLRTYLKVQVE